MVRRRLCALGALAASLMSLWGCAHEMTIDSSPPGATIYLDGERIGTAPVTVEERSGFFEEKKLKAELDGYETLETTITQGVPIWAVVGPSVCLAPFTFGLSCVGLKWSTMYPPSHEFRLSPILKDGQPPPETSPDDNAPPTDPNATIPY